MDFLRLKKSVWGFGTEPKKEGMKEEIRSCGIVESQLEGKVYRKILTSYQGKRTDVYITMECTKRRREKV